MLTSLQKAPEGAFALRLAQPLKSRPPAHDRPGDAHDGTYFNTSTIGPAPVTRKSWWMSALATSSRTAIAGYMGASLRSAGPRISVAGRSPLREAIRDSKPHAYP